MHYDWSLLDTHDSTTDHYMHTRTVRQIEIFLRDIGAKDIVINKLGVDETKVTSEAKFIEDLGADSLDTVELLMALEEKFDCEIDEADAEKLTKVSDIVSYVEALAA